MKLLVTTIVLASLAAYSNAVGPLSVQGNKVLVNGKSRSLRGNSLFWSNNGWGGEKYYNDQVVNWLKSDWKSEVIRTAMGVEPVGGYLTDRIGNKNKVITVVDAAIKADMYVIIDWHSHEAHLYQWEAVAFFQEMANKYGKYNNVIYEIYNEPKNNADWSKHIKPYALAVIGAIRAIDPDNLIVVGTPWWSSGVDIAANDPITEFKNIAYTLHFYSGSSGPNSQDKAIAALRKGIALFVTEWGTVNYNGDGPVAAEATYKWINFLEQNGISYCNWSINDKVEGASALKPGASPNGTWILSSLTNSGNFVRNLLRSYANKI